MNCPACQVEARPDAVFCANCGTRLGSATDAAQPGMPQSGMPQSGPPWPSTPSRSLPPVSFDPARLSTVDKIVTGATLITMISIWLPWFTGSASFLGVTESASVSGTGYHGWLWFEFIVALVLLAYLVARALWETLPVKVPVAHEPLLIAGTGLQFLLILIAFFDWPSNTVADGIVVTFSLSVGAFLGLIFSIVAAAPVIVPAVRSYLESRNAAGGSRSF